MPTSTSAVARSLVNSLTTNVSSSDPAAGLPGLANASALCSSSHAARPVSVRCIFGRRLTLAVRFRDQAGNRCSKKTVSSKRR